MRNYTKIGIIREGKVPPDKRVTLSPTHCRTLLDMYPDLDLVVQPSPIRAFKDEEYAEQGIRLAEDLLDRELIIGVKEVPIKDLLPNKAYLFFSHTTKKQPYNKALLQAIVDKGITLLDHELLENETGHRVIAFGRFAGIVGAYNGLRAFCKQELDITLKPAHQCHDQIEMESQLQGIAFPADLRIVLSGTGRVAGGAMEVLRGAGFEEVPMEVIEKGSNTLPCFHALTTEEMYSSTVHEGFKENEFYADPSTYRCLLPKKLTTAAIYIACHYWNPKGPMLLTKSDLEKLNQLKIIADISCDITKPIASTLRSTTIKDPFFGFDRTTGTEVAFNRNGSLGVMSIDNLPCELPRDSSLAFGQQFIDHVASYMMKADSNGMLERATIVKEGSLTLPYDYLRDWLSKDQT